MLDDERLADLLEELPEAEQLRIIEGLDLERLLGVLDEMEYDDLADLLAEMPGEQRTRILEAMEPEEADVMRQLLSYEEGTAGGLMTPEIIVLGPTATVAEALAQVRDPDWLVSIAAQVFVVPAAVQAADRHLPRRRPLPAAAARAAERWSSTTASNRSRACRRRCSTRRSPSGWPRYNLLAIPVCDEAGRLLGAITVDDVLDRTLPAGWRQRRRQTPADERVNSR